jgi:hypothetical protein
VAAGGTSKRCTSLNYPVLCQGCAIITSTRELPNVCTGVARRTSAVRELPARRRRRQWNVTGVARTSSAATRIIAVCDFGVSVGYPPDLLLKRRTHRTLLRYRSFRVHEAHKSDPNSDMISCRLVHPQLRPGGQKVKLLSRSRDPLRTPTGGLCDGPTLRMSGEWCHGSRPSLMIASTRFWANASPELVASSRLDLTRPERDQIHHVALAIEQRCVVTSTVTTVEWVVATEVVAEVIAETAVVAKVITETVAAWLRSFRWRSSPVRVLFKTGWCCYHKSFWDTDRNSSSYIRLGQILDLKQVRAYSLDTAHRPLSIIDSPEYWCRNGEYSDAVTRSSRVTGMALDAHSILVYTNV